MGAPVQADDDGHEADVTACITAGGGGGDGSYQGARDDMAERGKTGGGTSLGRRRDTKKRKHQCVVAVGDDQNVC